MVTVSYDAKDRVEETVYFDDYGRKQAAYITKTLDVGGVPRVGHELRISLPDVFVRRAIKLTEGPVPAEKFQLPADAYIRVGRPE